MQLLGSQNDMATIRLVWFKINKDVHTSLGNDEDNRGANDGNHQIRVDDGILHPNIHMDDGILRHHNKDSRGILRQ